MADRRAERETGPRPKEGLVERLWADDLGLLGRAAGALLTPLELVFHGVVAARNAAYDRGLLPTTTPSVPTLSVGNLSVGGTGKTPLVRWLARRLLEAGHTPGILHGGYADDEPALYRQWFPDSPVLARRDRVAAAGDAVAEGADVLVLDDAFQHRRVGRHLDLVVVAAERAARRPRLLPRGAYREPLSALERADAVIVTRRVAAPAEALARAASFAGRFELPTAVAHLAPGAWLDGSGRPRDGAPDEEAVAVAAIGQPEAFFQQAKRAGATLAGTFIFRDHHPYDAEDAGRIAAADRPIVTTAKDAVKLRAHLEAERLWVLDQAVRIEAGEDLLWTRITEAMA